MPEIALPAIGIVFVAIMAILLLLATPAFTRMLQETIGRLPLVGGSIAGILTSAFQLASSGLLGWANSQAAAAATLVYGIVSAIWALPGSVVDSLGSSVAAISRLATRLNRAAYDLQLNINAAATSAAAALAAAAHSLQLNINAAATTAAAALVAALADVYATVNHVATSLQNNINSAVSTAAAALTGAVADVYATVNHVAASLQNNINSVGQTAEADIASVAAAAAAALATTASGLETYAQHTAAGAVNSFASELDQAAHDLVLGPWAALLPELRVIVAHLPAEITQALPGLETLPETVPLSLPAVLSILSTAVAAIGAETSTCAVPMCENLGGLSNLLNVLAADAFWVAIVALVAEAVHDPAAAVSGLVGEVAPPITVLSREVRNLVGV